MPFREEQRRYFRVNTDMPISFDVLSTEVKSDLQASSKDVVYPQDARIGQLLASIQSSDPIVFELISLVNEKISSSQRKIPKNKDENCQCTIQRVSLSACGMALLDGEEHGIGEKVRLHLELPDRTIHLNANVVDCQKVVQGDFRVRLDFVNLSAEDEDMLVQYVMQCDAKNRRHSQYNH